MGKANISKTKSNGPAPANAAGKRTTRNVDLSVAEEVLQTFHDNIVAGNNQPGKIRKRRAAEPKTSDSDNESEDSSGENSDDARDSSESVRSSSEDEGDDSDELDLDLVEEDPSSDQENPLTGSKRKVRGKRGSRKRRSLPRRESPAEQQLPGPGQSFVSAPSNLHEMPAPLQMMWLQVSRVPSWHQNQQQSQSLRDLHALFIACLLLALSSITAALS